MPVTVPVMGHDEQVGIGMESTYGTGVAATIPFRPASNTFAKKPQVSQLQGSSGKMVPYHYDASLPRHYAGPGDFSGQIVIECEYDDFGWILRNTLGDSVSTNGTGAGTTHVFEIPDATPTVMPDSISVHRGTTPAIAMDPRIGGGMINTLTLRGQPGQYITATLDMVGSSDGVTDIAFPSLTYSTAPWMEFFHSDIGIDAAFSKPTGSEFYATAAAGGEVSEWTMVIQNNLDISEAAGGASNAIRPPVWNDFRVAELTFTKRWHDLTVWNLIHPSTEDARYRYVSLLIDSNVATAGDAGNWSLRFDMPAAIFLGEPAMYEGGGGFITENVRCQAAADGTNAPLTVTLINETIEPAYE